MSTRPRTKLLSRWLPWWRRDALRTTLWVVPSVLVVLAGLLFLLTYVVDRAAANGSIALPGWMNSGGAGVARGILTAIAAAIITVVGVVFSIVILALTLASTQFGPRVLRNFIRDLGTQLTLGVFVATFVYAVLALGSIRSGPPTEFVPHFTVTVALGALLVDLGVLIYFIHHVAVSIQLNEVIAGIGRDLGDAIDELRGGDRTEGVRADPGDAELLDLVDRMGAEVPATRSGYLQIVAVEELSRVASKRSVTIRLLHRPGHFVIAGRPLAKVWPPDSAGAVTQALDRAHVTGRHRTLAQDPIFAIDQLVEIAIRALSPAVNDTFTALACIDWLAAGLHRLAGRSLPESLRRDETGVVRLIQPGLGYRRIVDGAFDKIRQAARGMPAVLIRQLDALARIADGTEDPAAWAVLARQTEMIVRESEDSVPEEEDRTDVARRYERFLVVASRDRASSTTPE
jgi:uncharacterized membrane protein